MKNERKAGRPDLRRIVGSGMFAHACPHMTNSRCSICLALDEIASMIEEHGTLDEKQVDRVYNLATGKAR